MTVLAQCEGNITISSSDDASKLESCTFYEGNIIISSNAIGQIDVPGVQTITGNFTCAHASSLTAISATSLRQIGGILDLEELRNLNFLQLPAINRIEGIRWISLPALQSLSFGSGVTQADQVNISNTGLLDLRGIELTKVAYMNIENNAYLKTVILNSLTNVTQTLLFATNSAELDLSFPNLESAADLTFRTVSSISMPSLFDVQGAMSFYSSHFDNFAAPNLTGIGGTIVFVDSAINGLDMPNLGSIGGALFLANNTNLKNISLNGLRTLGSPEMYGSFNQ